MGKTAYVTYTLPKEDESYIKWYRRQEKNKPDHLGKEEYIVEILSILSDHVQRYDSLDEKEQEEERNKILDFADFFYKNNCNNELLYEVMENEWEGNPPLVLEMAEYFKDYEIKKVYLEKYKELKDIERNNINMLHDYILRIRKKRNISVSYSDGNISGLEILKTLPKENLEYISDILKGILVKTYLIGGTVILRIDSGKGINTLNGFRLGNGKISSIKAEMLRGLIPQTPEGSGNNVKQVEYRTAPLLFTLR